MERLLSAQRLVSYCGKLGNVQRNGDDRDLACEVSEGSKDSIGTVRVIFLRICERGLERWLNG